MAITITNIPNQQTGMSSGKIKITAIPQTSVPAQEKGFLSNVGQDLTKRFETASGAVEKAQQGKQSIVSGVLQTTGQIAGAGFDVLGEGIKAIPGAKEVGGAIGKGVGAIVDVLPKEVTDLGGEAVLAYKKLKREHPELVANAEAVGNIASILPIVRGAGAVASGVKTGIKKGVGVVANTADDVLTSASDLKKSIQVVVGKKNVGPQLKTSAERLVAKTTGGDVIPTTKEGLFLDGTKRLSDPVKSYDDFLAQSKKALGDIKEDPAIATVGNKMGDAFNEVVAQRRAVGAKMGEELKKVGGVKTDVTPMFADLETSLKEADLTYDGVAGKLVAGPNSKMVAEDISMMNQYIEGLNKLGATPTISEIDALIARSQALVNNYKSAKGIFETTNGERLIKGSLAKLREQFDPVKMKNPALTGYAAARKAYAGLSDFIDDGGSYLGKITQSGDFAKDASIAKSAVQSVLNNGKKDWMIRLEALTGYPAIDEAVLALQAMKDAGDFRGLSLLQAMSEGTVPTSKAGFTQKAIDYAVSKGSRVIAGTPEEQTRAFLNSLSGKKAKEVVNKLIAPKGTGGKVPAKISIPAKVAPVVAPVVAPAVKGAGSTIFRYSEKAVDEVKKVPGKVMKYHNSIPNKSGGFIKNPLAETAAKVEVKGASKVGNNELSAMFNNENTTDKVIASRIDTSSLERLSGGTTRNVYRVGEDKVVKVAKNPRGLEQNDMAADYFIQKNDHFPKIYETGKDYVVAEYVPRNDSVARKYLKPLQEFSQVDFDNKTSALQNVFDEMGLSDFLNYDLLWNDFKAVRNWGVRPDGVPVLIDEGALTKEVTSGSKISDMVQKDWNDILRMRKGAKPEVGAKVERYQ